MIKNNSNIDSDNDNFSDSDRGTDSNTNNYIDRDNCSIDSSSGNS